MSGRRNRQYAGMSKKQRFVEFGCSERFELLRELDDHHVEIKCKSCGYVFARETTFLNSSKNHNIECRACGIHADGTRTPPLSENKRGMDESVVVDYYLQGNSATQAALKFGMNLRRVRRIIDEAGVARDTQAVMELDEYPDAVTGDPWLDEEFTCPECGRVFTRYQRMVKDSTFKSQRRGRTVKYCSAKCRTRHGNKTKNTARSRKCAVSSGDVIPLGDLVKRDHGICQLCGGEVDLGDGYYDGDGHFHTGKMYPTIDHIIPVSKGGRHVWENVQLAHQGCNSRKRDSMPAAKSA